MGSDLPNAFFRRAFKKHMFQKMGYTAAQILAFGRGTRLNQAIHADDRAGGHFLHQDRQTVIEDLLAGRISVCREGKKKTNGCDRKTGAGLTHIYFYRRSSSFL